MISEPEFKKNLIGALNSNGGEWVDGDEENNKTKTVDVVSHGLKIAIEIKDDTTYKVVHPEPGRTVIQTNDLNRKSNQWKDDARDANAKFKNYQDYKTILIIRTEMIDRPPTVLYIMRGLLRYKKGVSGLVPWSNKNTHLSGSSTKEIGAYVFCGETGFFYYKNPIGDTARIIELKELAIMMGWDIKDLSEVSE
jgi:hypothetical protein